MLLSVAFDGLAAASTFIRDKFLNFLEGKSNVGKAIRSQLVLGSNFTTIGDSFFDVGILNESGIRQSLKEMSASLRLLKRR